MPSKDAASLKAIMARALTDSDFKTELLKSPKDALVSHGYDKKLSPNALAAISKIKSTDLGIKLADLDSVSYRFTVAATAQWD